MGRGAWCRRGACGCVGGPRWAGRRPLARQGGSVDGATVLMWVSCTRLRLVQEKTRGRACNGLGSGTTAEEGPTLHPPTQA